MNYYSIILFQLVAASPSYFIWPVNYGNVLLFQLLVASPVLFHVSFDMNYYSIILFQLVAASPVLFYVNVSIDAYYDSIILFLLVAAVLYWCNFFWVVFGDLWVSVSSLHCIIMCAIWFESSESDVLLWFIKSFHLCTRAQCPVRSETRILRYLQLLIIISVGTHALTLGLIKEVVWLCCAPTCAHGWLACITPNARQYRRFQL